MKSVTVTCEKAVYESLPARGAWIEIKNQEPDPVSWQSLPARGAWIEISLAKRLPLLTLSRSPQGGRGLKSAVGHEGVPPRPSLPARGAWIEIFVTLFFGRS